MKNCAEKHPLVNIWPLQTVPQTGSCNPGRASDRWEGVGWCPTHSAERRDHVGSLSAQSSSGQSLQLSQRHCPPPTVWMPECSTLPLSTLVGSLGASRIRQGLRSTLIASCQHTPTGTPLGCLGSIPKKQKKVFTNKSPRNLYITQSNFLCYRCLQCSHILTVCEHLHCTLAYGERHIHKGGDRAALHCDGGDSHTNCVPQSEVYFL